MWALRIIAIAFAIVWLAVTVVIIWFRLADLINKEEKISMAYIKLEGNEEGGKLDIDDGVPLDTELEGDDPIGDEAASDEARSLMRVINDIGNHCSAIKTILATIPPNPARTVAQQKVAEVQMWAGQAFIENEL